MAARGDRAIRRDHWRALDRKAGGATLIEQEGATRTTGSGLAQRRAGERERVRRCAWRERSRPRGRQVLEGLPGDLEHHAQPGLPDWRGRTTARPDDGGTPRGIWPSPRTKHVKRLRTDKSARLREDSPEKRNGRDDAGEQSSTGERAQGPRKKLSFWVQRVRKGRKRPTSPNLPSAAFPDFLELHSAEVRTSAGRRSVPGMSPGTSISAVHSQD